MWGIHRVVCRETGFIECIWISRDAQFQRSAPFFVGPMPVHVESATATINLFAQHGL